MTFDHTTLRREFDKEAIRIYWENIAKVLIEARDINGKPAVQWQTEAIADYWLSILDEYKKQVREKIEGKKYWYEKMGSSDAQYAARVLTDILEDKLLQ
jgi:hypothetical protein